MFRKKRSIVLAAGTLLLVVLPRVLLSADDYLVRSVTVSFVPSVSTNARDHERVRTNVSFSLIGGDVGQLEGGELGSVFNIEQDRAIGYQAAGAFNLVGGDFTGVQQAGAVNLVRGDFHIAQFAGAVNLVGGGLTGAQFAGGCNLTRRCTGAQFAPVNVTGNCCGAQFGVVNIADLLTGLQLGTVNIASNAKGLQFGVVNIADKLDGAAIGVVSVIRNGQFHVNLWGDETALLNLGIKFGSKAVYNVFAFGLQPRGDSTYWLPSYGIGGHIPIQRFFLDIDALGSNVERGPAWWENEYLNLLGKLRLTGGFQATRWLAVTGGVTVNTFVSTQDDGAALASYALDFYRVNSQGTHVRVWPGFGVGVQLP